MANDFPLCLIGSGVRSTPGQVMQEAALAATGRTGGYAVLDVEPSGLPSVLNDIRAGRYRGANVTAPYKLAIAAACDVLEGDAALSGAVNTLAVDQEGRLCGANTDAAGFELALSGRRQWPTPGARAVVIGAGGAAAAVILALSRVPASRITVVARRINAARALVDGLAGHGVDAELVLALWDEDYLARILATADIVVNATSAGLDEMPFGVDALQPSCTVADVRHGPRPVDLVAASSARGLRASDGVDMLFHQGMLSFARWTGSEPPYAAARAALDAAVGP